MSINCSFNPQLEELEAKKAEMQAQLDSAKNLGASALGDVKAKADELKGKLTAGFPEIPKPPNFKQELSKLKGLQGKAATDAKAEFEKRWGNALPDVDIKGMTDALTNPLAGVTQGISNVVGAAEGALSGAAASITNTVSGLASDAASGLLPGGGAISSLKEKASFDLCSDAPNVDAPDINPETGEVEKVVFKAPEPTTAVDNAKKVEELVDEKVDKATETSSGVSDKSFKEIEEEYAKYREEVDTFFKGIRTKLEDARKKAIKAKKDPIIRQLIQKYGGGPIDNWAVAPYNSGELDEGQQAAVEAFINPQQEYYKASAQLRGTQASIRDLEEAYRNKDNIFERIADRSRNAELYYYSAYVVESRDLQTLIGRIPTGTSQITKKQEVFAAELREDATAIVKKYKSVIQDYYEYKDQ